MQSFLYKALGTVLGASKGVLHVQEKLLQHLEEANAEEPWEAQVSSPLLSSSSCQHPRSVPGGQRASPSPAAGLSISSLLPFSSGEDL